MPTDFNDIYGLFGEANNYSIVRPHAVILPKFLTRKECDEFLNLLTEDSPYVAGVDDANKYGIGGDERIEARNFVLNPAATYEQHTKIFNSLRSVNNMYFHYSKLFLNYQYPLYVSEYWKGCFRSWHYDGGIVDPLEKSYVDQYQKKLFDARTLTMVVQLDDGKDYTGGDLNFFNYQNTYHPKKRDKGTAIIFPSTTWHEVSKVKSGVRHSLSLFLYSNEVKK